MSLQTKIKVISVYSLYFNTWCNVQCWEVVVYPLQDILLVDVATAMPSPGEYGDSATDLPFKRLCLMMYVQKSLMFQTVTTVVSILGPTNVVCSTTLYSHFCGGVYSSSLCTTAAKASSH